MSTQSLPTFTTVEFRLCRKCSQPDKGLITYHLLPPGCPRRTVTIGRAILILAAAVALLAAPGCIVDLGCDEHRHHPRPHIRDFGSTSPSTPPRETIEDPPAPAVEKVQ